MTLSHGSLTIFFTRPVSAFLLACSLLAITAPLIIKLMQSRKQVPA